MSWKPREMAIPPMPSAVMAALTSMPKQVDSTTDAPISQMTTRTMLTKMLDEGKGELSRLST